MSRAELTPLLLVAFVLTLCTQLARVAVLVNTDADTGLIEGTVSYENGSSASSATVYASPMGRPMMGIIPHAAEAEGCGMPVGTVIKP